MHSGDTINSNPFEAVDYSEVPYETLESGETRYIDTEAPMAEELGYKVLAEIRLSGEHGDYIQDDEFLLLDLRESPEVDGYKAPFGESGTQFDRSIAFLVVNKEFDAADPHVQRGYKGIRAGETITLGRHHQDHRFRYSAFVSADHMQITYDHEGNLAVHDLNSTNKSYVRTVPGNHEDDAGHEDQQAAAYQRLRDNWEADLRQRQEAQARENKARQAARQKEAAEYQRLQSEIDEADKRRRKVEDEYLAQFDPKTASRIRLVRLDEFKDEITLSGAKVLLDKIDEKRSDGKSDRTIYGELMKKVHSDLNSDTRVKAWARLIPKIYDNHAKVFRIDPPKPDSQ